MHVLPAIQTLHSSLQNYKFFILHRYIFLYKKTLRHSAPVFAAISNFFQKETSVPLPFIPRPSCHFPIERIKQSSSTCDLSFQHCATLIRFSYRKSKVRNSTKKKKKNCSRPKILKMPPRLIKICTLNVS